MAEIKIKKKQPIWPWILLILGILALIYYLFTRNTDDIDDMMRDDDTEMVRDTTEVSRERERTDAVVLSDMASSKISDYKGFIEDKEKMGVDHEYSKTALDKLIDATEAVANSLNVDIKTDLATARINADAITKDPTALNHAEKIKNAGNTITQSLKKIQMQKYPDLENSMSELENSLASITPATKTLEQKDVIQKFYDKAGEVLTNMKNN